MRKIIQTFFPAEYHKSRDIWVLLHIRPLNRLPSDYLAYKRLLLETNQGEIENTNEKLEGLDRTRIRAEQTRRKKDWHECIDYQKEIETGILSGKKLVSG